MPNPFLVASSLLLFVAAPAAVPAGVPDWKAVTLNLQQEQQRVTIQVPSVTITISATIIVLRAPHVVEQKAKD